MRPSEFEAKWSAEAEHLHRRGALVDGEQLLHEVVADFRAVQASQEDEVLSLAEAAQVSGYSPDHLARLVRTGRVPDRRPPGGRGRLMLRRSDLPLKPGRTHTRDADVHDLASRLYRGKEGRHGHP